MQHMAESFYNMKYSMELVLDDMELINTNGMKGYKVYCAKQFAKYHISSNFPINKMPSPLDYKA